jgi:NADP-dependent 3-hydroxy acid dehydrogenase YdfG
MSHQKVVFITGASSGVGHSTARWLSQKGYKVFGTSRNPASAEALPTVGMVALVKHHDGAM